MRKSEKNAAMNNMRVFMDKGPGLHRDYSTWVVAKDTANRRVLIGGLGAIGVGEMWFDMTEEVIGRTGFEEAPEQDSTGGFGVGGDPIANALKELEMLTKRERTGE